MLFVIGILYFVVNMSILSKSFRFIKSNSNVMRLQMSSVRVTTYNVLSSNLAGADYFRNCNPQYLESEYRFEKLKEKLNKETSLNSIICLQELSQTWTGKLHTYFANKGYYLTTALYGNKFNGYMGIGIAIPLNSYNIELVDIKRISDIKTVEYKPRQERPTILSKILSLTKQMIKNLFVTPQKPIQDAWDAALDRKNQFLSVIVNSKEDKKSFIIGTYHMPCMFQLPSVMTIHTALSTQYIQKFAAKKQLPYVFCGDFNISPKSSQYELITTGNITSKVYF